MRGVNSEIINYTSGNRHITKYNNIVPLTDRL